jgi:hypothetical protein
VQLAVVGSLGNLSVTVCPEMVAQVSLIEIMGSSDTNGLKVAGYVFEASATIRYCR